MQDFTKKISIIINKENEKWQSVNAVAHISAYLGNKMTAPFDTGEIFTTSDDLTYPRNSQFPIIVLESDCAQLKGLVPAVKTSGLLYLIFIKEMIETSDDMEIESIVKGKADENLEILGLGVFGDKDEVNKITKGFGLWKL